MTNHNRCRISLVPTPYNGHLFIYYLWSRSLNFEPVHRVASRGNDAFVRFKNSVTLLISWCNGDFDIWKGNEQRSIYNKLNEILGFVQDLNLIVEVEICTLHKSWTGLFNYRLLMKAITFLLLLKVFFFVNNLTMLRSFTRWVFVRQLRH